jgi:asparagine synthetase B (glutamine-hydrolysing)
VIPEEVRLRKKKGLSVPAARWLSGTRLPEWAETALSRAELDRAGLFNPDAVAQLRREHQRGAPARAALLMGVLSIQMWRRMFVESPRAGNGSWASWRNS